MEPKELAALYLFIRAQSRRYGEMGYTEIAGMLVYADRWTFSGHTGYVIGRGENTETPWNVTFKLVESDQYRDDRNVTIYHAAPRGRRGFDQVNSRTGIPTLVGTGGSYEGYMQDATLLRMFNHLWSGQ